VAGAHSTPATSRQRRDAKPKGKRGPRLEHLDVIVGGIPSVSFNGKLRAECLNTTWFQSLDDARRAIEAWRIDYNEVRPHSRLGHLPPATYVAVGSG
jgi:hypothetical protein